MMTISHPLFYGSLQTANKKGQANTESTLKRTMFKGKEVQAVYREALMDLDQDTLEKLYEIQRHPDGRGHEKAIEYGKKNPHIDWLNEERRMLLQMELVNRKINPKISAKAREMFHDLDKAINRTLQEDLIPDSDTHGSPPRKKRSLDNNDTSSFFVVV